MAIALVSRGRCIGGDGVPEKKSHDVTLLSKLGFLISANFGLVRINSSFTSYRLDYDQVISQVQFSHYKDLPLKLAVALVNSEDVVDGTENLDVALVQDLLDRSDLERAPRVQKSHVAAVRRLRTQVRAVFEAGSVDQAATVVNSILRAAGATPFVGIHGGGPHMHVAPEERTPDGWLGATIGMGLADLVVNYGTERFGVCSADDCRDVFIDVSRNHSRKHCSARCTNREGVRSFRRRQHAH